MSAALRHLRQDNRCATESEDGVQFALSSRRLMATLSAKERDVLDLVLAGLANKNIAKRLGYSLKTIEVRRQAVMHKLQADSVAQLVRTALVAEPNWQLPARLATPLPRTGQRVDAPAAAPLPVVWPSSVSTPSAIG